jgi:1-deoxy-D-xylulose-5-phosphate reductoisomerase
LKNKLLNINNSKNKTVKIALLGSTGSIGVQTLDVIKSSPNLIVNYLTTNTRIDILENQLQHFTPKAIVITDENSYKTFKQITKFKGQILYGLDGLTEIVNDSENDLVISALVGFAGVVPTIEALKRGTNVALANKETLVSAGELVYNIAKQHNSNIIAIDSEHSAILQCLIGEEFEQIEKIILTASGGPFLNKSKEEFKSIKSE